MRRWKVSDFLGGSGGIPVWNYNYANEMNLYLHIFRFHEACATGIEETERFLHVILLLLARFWLSAQFPLVART